MLDSSSSASASSGESGSPCRICGSPVDAVGSRYGQFARRSFTIGRCPQCGFACVVDPWLEYDLIYDNEYYEGRGADPHVDYVAALSDPDRTTQKFEWRGVLTCVERIAPVTDATHWLDYGCGVGGLVQYLRGHGIPHAVGFEQGWSVERLVEKGIPYLQAQDLPELAGTFDVVTAIEVIEHAIDPLAELRSMRALLKPGGILFVTTGNAEPYRHKLSEWRYIMPEVHISLFEPGTLALALDKAGFVAEYPGFGRGWTDMYHGEGPPDPGRTADGPHEQSPSVADPGQGVRSQAAARPATDRRGD